MKTEFEAEKLLYAYELEFAKVVDFGTSMEDLASEAFEIPKEGVRQDVHFKGNIVGEYINGTVEGVDYIYIRADGRFELTIFATITTGEGKKIALRATGVTTPTENPNVFDIKQSVTMMSNHDDYQWLNSLHIWGRGEVNMQDGKVSLRAYY